MIDNKDYNYTLVVSGQNFQIVHHDDGKNLTYKHGVNVSKMIMVAITGGRNVLKFSLKLLMMKYLELKLKTI